SWCSSTSRCQRVCQSIGGAGHVGGALPGALMAPPARSHCGVSGGELASRSVTASKDACPGATCYKVELLGRHVQGGWLMLRFAVGVAALAALAVSPGRAETPEEWIKLGERVHGAFGAFIPVGIRIGQDALQRLNAQPREVTVTYYDSDRAPCAC